MSLSLPWSGDGPATPITTTFAVVVLFAIIALVLLRHFFGDIRLDAGVK